MVSRAQVKEDQCAKKLENARDSEDENESLSVKIESSRRVITERECKRKAIEEPHESDDDTDVATVYLKKVKLAADLGVEDEVAPTDLAFGYGQDGLQHESEYFAEPSITDSLSIMSDFSNFDDSDYQALHDLLRMLDSDVNLQIDKVAHLERGDIRVTQKEKAFDSFCKVRRLLKEVEMTGLMHMSDEKVETLLNRARKLFYSTVSERLSSLPPNEEVIPVLTLLFNPKPSARPVNMNRYNLRKRKATESPSALVNDQAKHAIRAEASKKLKVTHEDLGMVDASTEVVDTVEVGAKEIAPMEEVPVGDQTAVATNYGTSTEVPVLSKELVNTLEMLASVAKQQTNDIPIPQFFIDHEDQFRKLMEQIKEAGDEMRVEMMKVFVANV
ncbi:hypothetical protein BU16DRAFT_567703 [Lophium mytilinum]|uniref:Uncharacterized protein n=1 Tax=Lophium mytilinum TaxID=390894 RepID=A0A6A6QBZ6_9PEZI|nr:hypothetical protein BU16DRAFT_567703 [Lophium mytilinum]